MHRGAQHRAMLGAAQGPVDPSQAPHSGMWSSLEALPTLLLQAAAPRTALREQAVPLLPPFASRLEFESMQLLFRAKFKMKDPKPAPQALPSTGCLVLTFSRHSPKGQRLPPAPGSQALGRRPGQTRAISGLPDSRPVRR